MKGKRTFTEREIEKIKDLVRRKVVSSRDEQKKIRRKIRKIGFFFSDFSDKKGYNVDDIDMLIEAGRIKILGRAKTTQRGNSQSHGVTQSTKNSSFNKYTEEGRTKSTGGDPTIVGSLQALDRPQFGLYPIFNSQTQILILGTFPAAESIQKNFYYANQETRFWGEALEKVGDFVGLPPSDKIKLLHQNRIGSWDVFEAVERGNSNQDSAIVKAKMNPIDKMLEIFSAVEVILFNGRNALDWLQEYQPDIFNNPQIRCLRRQSTSGANGHFYNGADWDEFFIQRGY